MPKAISNRPPDMMVDHQPSRSRIFLLWTVTFFLVMMAVWFLHEIAHGFGYRLEGIRVSTGFNLVGRSGRVPGEPEFELDLPVQGLTIGLLLGPLSTWVLAIVFTAILLRRSNRDQPTLFIGAVAVASAIMRLMPLAIFFIAALLGSSSGVWQDEQRMSLGAIESIKLPIAESELKGLIDSDPSMFFGDGGFYFWALVSAGISLTCLLLVYRHLFKLFRQQLQPRWRQFAFGLMPLILYFPIFGVVSMLDTVVRINW